MGGLFSAPKPVIVSATPSPSVGAAGSSQAADAAEQQEAAARDARLSALERARRGMPGTIATSARGVLDPLPGLAAARKSLLGE